MAEHGGTPVAVFRVLRAHQYIPHITGETEKTG